MNDRSNILQKLRQLLRDYRYRVLLLIAVAGIFAGIVCAVTAGAGGDHKYYYRDGSAQADPYGVKLYTAPTTVSTADSNVVVTERVDLNSASVYDLAGILPGIGEKKAQAIVEYRELTGGFNSVDELVEVEGISEKLLEKVRPYCYVETASDSDEH